MFVIYQEHGSMSVFQSENNLLILTGGGGGGGGLGSHPDAEIRRGPGHIYIVHIDSASLSGSLGYKWLFRSANNPQIADAVRELIVLLFLLCFFRRETTKMFRHYALRHHSL